MCHDQATRHAHLVYLRSNQRGAALVVAIFIITVMAILAAVIARVISTGAAASVDEVYGTRALQAANSGAQVFLVDLINAFEAENGDPVQVCISGSASITFDAPGLQNCTSEVSCTSTDYSNFGLTQFRVSSVGRCTSSSQQYSRVMAVEVVDGHF